MTATVDPKRTVKARPVTVFDADGGAPNGIDAEPGDCQRREPYRGETIERLMFACPGCGQWGSIGCGKPKPTSGIGGQVFKGPSWEIVAGALADVTALTLSPSIHCIGCCGWHGFLRNGVFESC